MMKKIGSLLMIISFMLISIEGFACSTPGQPPLPGINANPSFACVGDANMYAALYVGGGSDSVRHFWDWDDGTFDTLNKTIPGIEFQIPHVYNDSGTYTIQLIKVNPYGSDTSYKTIRVYDKPKANFIFDKTSLCVGEQVAITDLSSAAVNAGPLSSWVWGFGDGSFHFEEYVKQNPSINYKNADTFNVKLTVTDGVGCVNDTTIPIVATFDTTLAQFSLASGCPCNEITFANVSTGSANQWLWQFGDNDTSASSVVGTHTYTQPGDYYVTLKGTDANGCFYKDQQIITVCSGQSGAKSKSNYNWYFRDKGLSFSNGFNPTIKLDGTSSGGEESAAVSDPLTGDLLFYTDFRNVWDKNNVLMPAGTGLDGTGTSAQSVVIPVPGNRNRYYIVVNGVSTRIKYTIVDMTLNSRLGDVVPGKKNIQISNSTCCEEIDATRKNSAGCGTLESYWIVAPFDNGGAGNFKVFLASDTGIALISTQNVGSGNTHPIGKSMISKDGSMYILPVNNGFEIFDFDVSSGLLSNMKLIDFGYFSRIYGLSISPDKSKIYASTQSGASNLPKDSLWQFDLTVPLPATILASKFLVDVNSSVGFGGASIGPDGKIYMARFGSRKSLGVINRPNVKGLSCDFVANGVLYPTSLATFGLQHIVNLDPSDFIDTMQANFITDIDACPKANILFTNLSDSIIPTSSNDPCAFPQPQDSIIYDWDFGDLSTEKHFVLNNNVFNTLSPIHNYAPGLYNVQLIVSSGKHCPDTMQMNITIDTFPTYSFVSDSVCLGDTSHLTSSTTNFINLPLSYSWTSPITSTSSNPSEVLPVDGNFSVIMTITDSAGCSYRDTNTVVVHSVPVAIDTTIAICYGNTINLDGGSGTAYAWTPTTYLSDTSIQTQTLTPDSSITYQVIVSSQYCGTDTGIQTITVNPLPIVQTINDTTIDLGNSVILTTSGASTYSWNTSTYIDDANIPNPTSNSLTSITYIVTGTDANSCSSTDTIAITVEVKDDFYVPVAFSPNNDGENDVLQIRGLQGEKDLSFKVYDRWGNKVFESKSSGTPSVVEGWDGTYKNQALKDGVFVYVINVTLLNNQAIEKKGNVTLVK